MSSMAAGWYPDPFSSADYLRWWDGTQWTSRTTLPGSPHPTPPPRYAPTQVSEFPLASWGLRVGAYIIDLLIMGLVAAPIYAAVLWPAFRDLFDALPTDGSAVDASALADFETTVLGASLVLSVVSLVITFAYMVPQNVRYGRTVGKRAVGIRIRMLAEDRPPRWGEASIRWGVFAVGSMFAGGIFLLVDCLWPLWDKPWQQALHDKAAKTVVVPT